MLLQRQCIYALLHWTICPKYIPLHNMLLFLFYIFAKTKCKIIHLHNRHAFWHIYSMSFFVWQHISIVIMRKINTIISSLLRAIYISYQKLQKYKIQKVAFTARMLVMDDVSCDVRFYFYFISTASRQLCHKFIGMLKLALIPVEYAKSNSTTNAFEWTNTFCVWYMIDNQLP